ncbi:MAG: hypothetical protein JSW47_00945 [Phycisphaerales bacterium]|nr:MAG: hypothetical protein JSW47_00945 [Phycisphaerales bacterium]UCF15243.1 MAG: hypothetical protein JSW59_17695 [Phycisphaerales bacterium]
MIQVLQVISLAITAKQRWPGPSSSSISSGSSNEWLLSAFAMAALGLAIVLLFWVAIKRKRTEDNLRNNITDLTITTVKLRQQKDELAATNKELQQLVNELSRKQAEILDTTRSR